MIAPTRNTTIAGSEITATDKARQEPFRLLTLGMSVVTICLTIRYLVWRITVNNWHLWWLSVPLLAAELLTALHVLGYQYTVWPRRDRSLSITSDSSQLPIVFFIPTVNEGNAVLEPTIQGAQRARSRYIERYPEASVRIVLCNDGFVAGVPDWRAAIDLAGRCGVECITREIPGGAKAGNIEHARRQVGATGRCLLIVLDADQVAEPDFLIRTVAPFGDTSIGWVQTRQFYRNQDSAVARWAEHQAALFYDLVCPGKSTMNASYICGTNVVIRAEVLDRIGGFPQESITEDFAASIRTHHEWRSIYIRDVLAKGLGPLDLTGYYMQQSRWARGTIGVLRSDWKRLLLPFPNGLTFGQRVQYLLSATHYLCGIRDLVFLSSALVCLFLSDSPIKSTSLATILIYLLPYIFASQLLILLQVRSISLLTAISIGYGSFPTLVVSFFEAVTNKRMRFKVTPKRLTRSTDLSAIAPHLTIAAICIFVVAHAFVLHKALTTTDGVPLFWVLYAMLMLLPTFFVSRYLPGRDH